VKKNDKNSRFPIQGASPSQSAAPERERTEETLRENFMRHVIELSPVVLVVYDLVTGHHTYFSSDALTVYGYTGQEMAQMPDPFAVLLQPEDIPQLQENVNRLKLLGDDEINEFECRIRRGDGEQRWINARSMIFARDENGEARQVISATFDITERKHLEDTLRESEENYRVIVNQAVAGIFKHDLDGKVTFSNQRFCEMLDYTCEELLEISTEQIVYAEDSPRNNRLFKRLKNQGLSYEIEKRLVRKDGSLIWVSNQVAPVFDRAGNPKSIIVVSVDITERVQAEEALRQVNDDLEHRVIKRTRQLSDLNEDLKKEIKERERVEAERERLLRRSVSAQEDERQRIAREMHDQLGQNLSALALKLSALKNDYDQQPELRDHFASLKMIVKQLDADVGYLVRDLRPTALDDFGLVVALSNYVRNWSKQFGVRAELHTSGMEKDRLTSEIETVLYRITQEALNNISKHANAGNVDILLERHSDHVSLIVEDDGGGFDVEKIFGASEKGFGLISMRERAALVAGTLVVESNPGAGATIAVRIPAPHVPNGGNQNG
jgi:PAS domain S-box-containing protein